MFESCDAAQFISGFSAAIWHIAASRIQNVGTCYYFRLYRESKCRAAVRNDKFGGKSLTQDWSHLLVLLPWAVSVLEKPNFTVLMTDF